MGYTDLFVYRADETVGHKLSHALLSEALGIDAGELQLGPHGKPYIKGGPEFSISHTGGIWMCAVSDEPVGLDVQEKRTAKYESIAKRFFTGGEAKYIEAAGEKAQDAFYRLWARKEAYVKYTGMGFSGSAFQEFSVLDSRGEPAEIININGDGIRFTECAAPGNDNICVICRKEDNNDQIRIFVREQIGHFTYKG